MSSLLSIIVHWKVRLLKEVWRRDWNDSIPFSSDPGARELRTIKDSDFKVVLKQD
jgi:hypothetical protein